jgi:hypothetical protein
LWALILLGIGKEGGGPISHTRSMPLVFFGLPQSMSGVLKKLDMSLRERYKYFLDPMEGYS